MGKSRMMKHVIYPFPTVLTAELADAGKIGTFRNNKCKTINHNNMNKHPFLPAPAAVALCFGLLCLSALSSCTGCSYNHEKAMGSIDNISVSYTHLTLPTIRLV